MRFNINWSFYQRNRFSLCLRDKSYRQLSKTRLAFDTCQHFMSTAKAPNQFAVFEACRCCNAVEPFKIAAPKAPILDASRLKD